MYLAFQNGDHYQGAFRDFPGAFQHLRTQFPGYFEDGCRATADEVGGDWQWNHPSLPTYVQIMRVVVR